MRNYNVLCQYAFCVFILFPFSCYCCQAIDQVTWVKEVEDKLDSGKQHIDTLRAMYKKGSTLMQGKGTCIIIICHCETALVCTNFLVLFCLLFYLLVVENVMVRVKSLLTAGQEWEAKTKAVLKEK